MIDTFYELLEEDGVYFYVRYTDLQRLDGRTLEITDEVEVQAKVAKELADIEAKRDITYEEFKHGFQDHIEGKAVCNRTVHGSDDEAERPKEKEKSRSRSKGHISQKAPSKMDIQRNDETFDSKSNYSKEDIRSRTSKGATSEKLSKSITSNNFEDKKNNYKYELPESCYINVMKSLKIDKLESKFYLVSHPYPQIEGELLIFQPKKDDQSEEDLIVYRDYSLRKRIQTTEKAVGSSIKKKMSKADLEIDARLQCLEIDNDNPISNIEWRNFATVIKEVSGLGWFQILPTGQKSSQPF